MNESRLAYFILIAQTAEKAVQNQPDTAPNESLPLSRTLDLALSLPDSVKSATKAASVYRYLYVFENFLRELIQDTLVEVAQEKWWEAKIPQNIRDEVARSRETDEIKAWMALGIREEIALTTYPQLLSILEHRWKEDFEEIIKDKSLIQEARHIGHMRNAICHMSNIPDEEVSRIQQVLRDWFRAVAP